MKKSYYLCTRKTDKGGAVQKHNAEIAQLVEHNLAKVGVASSSLVFRSENQAVTNVAACFLSIINPIWGIFYVDLSPILSPKIELSYKEYFAA